MVNKEQMSKLIDELKNLTDSTVQISIWFSKIESSFKTTFLYTDFQYDVDENGIILLDENETDLGTYIPFDEIDICNYSIENMISILGKNINIDICLYED